MAFKENDDYYKMYATLTLQLALRENERAASESAAVAREAAHPHGDGAAMRDAFNVKTKSSSTINMSKNRRLNE